MRFARETKDKAQANNGADQYDVDTLAQQSTPDALKELESIDSAVKCPASVNVPYVVKLLKVTFEERKGTVLDKLPVYFLNAECYYWPKLPKTVHLYTRSCHECQRRKKPPTRPAGLLQPISPPTAPFQQIGMDLLGPFPPSTSGNRWIIVATDYLTRYAETKALPSGTAVEVAKFFIESIVLRHGAPEVLITDRGSSFMAQLTQEIFRLSHTSHRRTTAYHPQTNGLTERLNKSRDK
ncbi:DDE-type integrase/transposase/recombinase [Ixodes scapularis]